MSTKSTDGWNSFDTDPPESETILVYVETGERDHYWIIPATWESEKRRLVTPPATGNEKSRALFWRRYPEPPSFRRAAAAWKKPAVKRISEWLRDEENGDGLWGGIIKHPSPEMAEQIAKTFDPTLSMEEQRKVWEQFRKP